MDNSREIDSSLCFLEAGIRHMERRNRRAVSEEKTNQYIYKFAFSQLLTRPPMSDAKQYIKIDIEQIDNVLIAFLLYTNACVRKLVEGILFQVFNDYIMK